ncbi:MAG: tetratricopeptide repeat protein [Deltaproteobacteria bacterium]|nr:tetratricopeptide repeat protein [Deltaproteobacteria bacterium]
MSLNAAKTWLVMLVAGLFLTGYATPDGLDPPEQTGVVVAKKSRKKKRTTRKKRRTKRKSTKRKKRKQRKMKFSEVPEFDKKKEEKKPEEEEPAGPAKIRLPMVEEKKAAGATLEEQLLDQEIEQLREIIQTTPDGPSKSDLLFRLAERYYEKARAIYFTEMQEYDKKVEKWMKKRETDPDAAEPKIDNRKSQVYTKQTMDIYRIILKKYKDYHRRDEVLFTMGYNLYESGNKSEGVKMYWELIKGHPDSRFVPDAYLAMGEHYFNNDDVFNAKKAYERALKFEGSKVYTFALYKLGWCDYNLGEYEHALEKFKRVVDLAEQEAQKSSGDKNKIQLKREALQDMILAYTQIDALDSAKEYYLSKVGQLGALEYLGRLARTYEKQGKAEMVVKSFRLLLNDYPDDKDCPSFHNSIVMAYRKMNEREKVKQEVNRLIDQYKPGSRWAEVNKSNKMAIAKANSLVEGSLRDLVTSYHKEAQTTKSWDTYNLARAIYAKYLETFPDSEYAYKLRWYYSDILYKMSDFYTAAFEYGKVVDKDPKGVYSPESAYNAVLCWEKCIEMRDGPEKKDCRDWKAQTGKQKIGKEEDKTITKTDMRFVEKGVTRDMLQKKEIPFFEKKFLASADVYSNIAPNHDMYIPIRFKSAFVFYKYRHFSEMAKRFGEIIERHPDNEFAMRAVRVSLNSLYMKAKQKDATDAERNSAWNDVNHWAKTFKANKVLMSSKAASKEKFADEIQSLIEESGYNVVLALRKTAPLEAAKGFDQFVADYPKSKYAHRAQYAAMVIYDEANQLDLAIKAGKALLENYKSSDRYNQTIGFLAAFHDRVADFATSARYNEMYFEKWLEQQGKPKSKSKKHQPKKRRGRGKKAAEGELILITDKQASDALYNAALMRESMGQFAKAIKNYGSYIKHFPENDDTPNIFYKIGLIYERQGKWRQADRVFEGYPDKYSDRSTPGRLLNAVYKHAMALRKLDKVRDSDKLLDKIIDRYNKLPEKARNEEARTAVAHARFLQIEKEYKEYIDLKLVLPPRTLRRNLFKKIDTRPKLEKKYEEVVSYKDPDWSVAALVRIGELSMDLATAMLEAPVPAGLTPEQQDIYVEELQKQALPLEEKSSGFLNKAIQVSNSKGIYNRWTLHAQDLLRKYQPNLYPPPYEASLVSTEFFYERPLHTAKVEEPPPEEIEVPAKEPGPGSETEAAGPSS